MAMCCRTCLRIVLLEGSESLMQREPESDLSLVGLVG